MEIEEGLPFTRMTTMTMMMITDHLLEVLGDFSVDYHIYILCTCIPYLPYGISTILVRTYIHNKIRVFDAIIWRTMAGRVSLHSNYDVVSYVRYLM